VCVVQEAERGGAPCIGTFQRGQCDAHGPGAETVLGDGLWLRDAKQSPAGAGEVLEVARLEQERRHSCQHMIVLSGCRETRLVAHVDTASGPAADKAFLAQDPDRRLHRHAGDTEEPRQLLPGRELCPGLRRRCLKG
jgi:hypothetical protein